MSDTPSTAKGYGRIYVDMHNAPEGIKIPVSGRIAWDMLEIRELVDLFQAHIDLLPEYTITGVFFDVSRRAWCLLVESETLPLPEFGEMMPLLLPVWQMGEDKRIHMIDVKIMR